MTIAMIAPAGVTSISVPSQAFAATGALIVQSPTGLKSPIFPANVVYQVVAGQISAQPADVPALVQAGFRVASLVSNAAPNIPNFGSVPVTGIPNP